MAEELLTKKGIQELLSEQTTVILTAVDERLDKVDDKIRALDLKFSERFDNLTKTLDKFLKRMTDMEEEFAMMRNDINRIKKTIKEKLGVELS